LLAATIAATLATTSFLRAEEENITNNGNFENSLTGWWASPGFGEIVSDTADSANNCLKLTGGFVFQDKRPIEGGKSYAISMRIRDEGVPAGAVYVQLSYRGGDLKPAWFGPESVTVGDHNEKALFVSDGGKDWKNYTAVVIAPDQATEILLYLRITNPDKAGAGFFDDIKVVPAP
jgi:hypothetical protein